MKGAIPSLLVLAFVVAGCVGCGDDADRPGPGADAAPPREATWEPVERLFGVELPSGSTRLSTGSPPRLDGPTEDVVVASAAEERIAASFLRESLPANAVEGPPQRWSIPGAGGLVTVELRPAEAAPTPVTPPVGTRCWIVLHHQRPPQPPPQPPPPPPPPAVEAPPCRPGAAVRFDELRPSAGVIGGGEPVKLRGSGFCAAGRYEVYFGSRRAKSVTFQSPTLLMVSTPEAPETGLVDVRLVIGGGKELLRREAFRYVENQSWNLTDGFGGKRR